MDGTTHTIASLSFDDSAIIAATLPSTADAIGGVFKPVFHTPMVPQDSVFHPPMVPRDPVFHTPMVPRDPVPIPTSTPTAAAVLNAPRPDKSATVTKPHPVVMREPPPTQLDGTQHHNLNETFTMPGTSMSNPDHVDNSDSSSLPSTSRSSSASHNIIRKHSF